MEPPAADAVPTCDVFAVFKDKTVPRSALDALELSELRARYVMLKAIGSREEAAQCDTFAVVAPPNRVVVDRAAFQDQISRKIREQVEARSLEEVERAIARLQSETDAFFKSERAHMQETVRADVLAAVQQARAAGGTDDAWAQLVAAVDAAFAKPTAIRGAPALEQEAQQHTEPSK